MIKLLLTLLSFFLYLFAFTACDSSSNRKGPSGDIAKPYRPSGLGNGATYSASDLINALNFEERRLERLYAVEFKHTNGLYSHLDLPSNAKIQRLAVQNSMSENDFKALMYKDIYTFGLNQFVLKNNQGLIERYSKTAFQTALQKSIHASNASALKRLNLAFVMEKEINDNYKLEDFGVRSYEVVNLKNTQIYLTQIIGNINNQNDLYKITQRAKNICASIEDFNTPYGKQILEGLMGIYRGPYSCLENESTIAFSKIHNKDMSPQAIDQENQNILASLDIKANTLLLENGIIANSSFIEGYDIQKRAEWRLGIRAQHTSTPPIKLQQAMQNNFYENTYFKQRLIEARILLLGHMHSAAEHQLHMDVLRQFRRLSQQSLYTPNLDISVGSSPIL